MLTARNNAALTVPVSIAAAGAMVSFDTIDITTGHATMSNNLVTISDTGYYNTYCDVTLTNSGTDEVTVTLTEMQDGSAAAGAAAKVTIPASGTAEVALERVIHVIGAQTGAATISWNISGGAVSMNNAYCIISRYA